MIGWTGWGERLACDDNVVNILSVPPLGEVLVDLVWLLDVEIASFWSSEETRVVFNSIAFCWSVYDAHHLIKV